MFEKMIRFFIDNSKMNYMLFFLVFAAGIVAYTKTPKEIFPSFDLDMISIRGSYSGASVDILNKMAVNEIEDNIKNIDGIDVVTSVISPGKFSIIIELKKGSNRYNIANEIKDAVTLTVPDLPDDMDEPSTHVIEIKRDLIELSIVSDKLSLFDLKEVAKDTKDRILDIPNISEVTIFGDSDLYYEVIINEKKIDAYDVNKSDVYEAIGSLSYTFPLGKIEGKKHFLLSTYNGAKTKEEFEDSLIRINNQNIYVKDIAQVNKRYEESSTLFSIDGKHALNLRVKMNNSGNAIEIRDQIFKLMEQTNKSFENIDFILRDDNSERIKDRLNIVISNILLGLILITLLVSILINTRMALVIAIGIPTSFVIGALYFYISGYTINMISLVGVLLALGIVVDDAIVVTENIQQHIEEGMNAKDAAIQGAKEMAKPVIIASITTLFSFIPILMISGTMGEVMKLIPIAFSALIVASLIESFIFLPIHAAHILKPKAKTLSWERVNLIYSDIIHFCMRWKKSFLIIFIIFVPVVTFISLKNSKFQMFPRFDATKVNITMKADVNTTLEESYAIVHSIEKDLKKVQKEFDIKIISSIAGTRMDNGGNSESYPYVMYMTLELEKLKPMNFVDKYITPYLSFYYDKEGRTRDQESIVISEKLKQWLAQQNYKEKFDLTDIAMRERKVGPIKSDVKIGFSSNNYFKAVKHIQKIQEEIGLLKGVKNYSNSATFGIDEIKIKVSSYGEKLGIDEAYIGRFLSNLYLEKKKGTSFDQEGMLDIKISSTNKDDLESFKNLGIPLKDGNIARLHEIVELQTIRSFEKLTKENGIVNFFLYANVNPKQITATEVIAKIQPLLDEAQKDGIKLLFKGEEEKKASLRTDMLSATAVAMLLIMFSLLFLFNSFKETFIVMSVIPFSSLGVLIGHFVMGLNLTMPAIVGALGLAGVVINDGIIMMTFLKKAKTIEDVFVMAAKRFRPILLTTVTTIVGLSSLIFFPTGEASIFQPMAIAIGFGLAWGTVLNLIYLPVLYSFANKLK
jgi:multidrug efflux pump subunit AcrB